MSEKEKQTPQKEPEILEDEVLEGEVQEAPEQPEAPEAPETGAADVEALRKELQELKTVEAQHKEQFLRLAAEYENYRRRTAKEKESIWADVKGETALKFLPVYDNLERALKQETADEAYKKGVEMTMTQLKSVLEQLGVTEIPALGQTFDPNLHNAVMHVEDENFGENTVAEVFQAGFQLGEKVIRFAMVKVAN